MMSVVVASAHSAISLISESGFPFRHPLTHKPPLAATATTSVCARSLLRVTMPMWPYVIIRVLPTLPSLCVLVFNEISALVFPI
jgi:hypothetical protein